MKKIALVHDWLVTFAGAEKVLKELLELYPQADLFSVIDFLSDEDREKIGNKRAKTTFIQKIPFSKKKYRSLLPLMPIAIEQLDLSEYDIIISSSHAVAKGIITGPNQIHISYVHSPIRYAWDLQHQYLKEANLIKGIKSLFAKIILHYIRSWDYRTSNGVDIFIGNSNFICKRIKKVYNRDAITIYPPVAVQKFNNELKYEDKKDYYITASRLVPYKKIDLIAKAFTKMPDKKLIIIGDGPDRNKILNIASQFSNITYLGYQDDKILRKKIAEARAFVFAAEEDFGIIPVEAQAAGTPVIAFGKGGALETVIDLESESNGTGVFFKEQTIESICDAINRFENKLNLISKKNLEKNASKFDETEFKRKIASVVREYL